jgi:hypothetical protein
MKNSKFKERVGWIRFPILANFTVNVVITTDMQLSINRRNGILSPCTVGKNALGSTWKHGVGGVIFIFLHKDVGKNVEPSTIAHECFHAVRTLMSNIGAEVEDELWAYHLGYLVGEVHKLLEKKV